MLARELLAMSDERFRAAFQHSPMKRAKLRGLKRNADVVLGTSAPRQMYTPAHWAPYEG